MISLWGGVLFLFPVRWPCTPCLRQRRNLQPLTYTCQYMRIEIWSYCDAVLQRCIIMEMYIYCILRSLVYLEYPHLVNFVWCCRMWWFIPSEGVFHVPSKQEGSLWLDWSHPETIAWYSSGFIFLSPLIVCWAKDLQLRASPHDVFSAIGWNLKAIWGRRFGLVDISFTLSCVQLIKDTWSSLDLV